VLVRRIRRNGKTVLGRTPLKEAVEDPEPHNEAVKEHLHCIVDLRMMRMRPSRNRKKSA
jgi:hypothetical protein